MHHQDCAWIGPSLVVRNSNFTWTSELQTTLYNIIICCLITQQHSTASELDHLSMVAGVLLVGWLPPMPSCCQRNAPARWCWKAPLLDAKFSSGARQGISLMIRSHDRFKSKLQKLFTVSSQEAFHLSNHSPWFGPSCPPDHPPCQYRRWIWR